MILKTRVLVLNQNYEPINICNTKRAINLLGKGKAENVIETGEYLHSINSIFEKPDVIRLYYMVKRPLQRKKLTRKEIFERDKFKCQYCGSNTKSLTFDHIIPRCKGGSLSWTNIVSACKTCNLHKAGKTPKEAGMKLINLPKEPKPNRYSFIYQETIKNSWIPFIPWGKKEYSYTNSKENFVISN